MAQAEYYAWIKAHINTVKKQDETYSDERILAAISEIEQVILNYCFIPAVPMALKYTWANMTLDLLRTLYPSEDSSSSSSDPVVTGNVTSIKEGDTEVKFSTDAKSGYTHAPDMDDLIMNYRQQLQIFRRII